MSRYESPELLQVGAIEQVVFGSPNLELQKDNTSGQPFSPETLSVLDFD